MKYFLLDKSGRGGGANTAEMLSSASSRKDSKDDGAVNRGATGIGVIGGNTTTSSGSAADLDDENVGHFGEPVESNMVAVTVAPYAAGRAAGEMVGVIHSASIAHLTIKIVTESGDYLSLTVSNQYILL